MRVKIVDNKVIISSADNPILLLTENDAKILLKKLETALNKNKVHVQSTINTDHIIGYELNYTMSGYDLPKVEVIKDDETE